MTKRLVEVDDVLLRKARTVLRTHTIKDTVNGALAEVIKDRRKRVREALDGLAAMGARGELKDRSDAW